MRTGVRLVAMTVVAALLASAVPPPVALAQAPAPAPAQTTAPPVAQQPGMMQEQMKKGDDGIYQVGANIFNVFYVPGKVITCGAGGLFALAALLATFGSGHRAAAGVIQEGCGGRWTLTADDVRPVPEEDFYQPASRLGR